MIRRYFQIIFLTVKLETNHLTKDKNNKQRVDLIAKQRLDDEHENNGEKCYCFLDILVGLFKLPCCSCSPCLSVARIHHYFGLHYSCNLKANSWHSLAGKYQVCYFSKKLYLLGGVILILFIYLLINFIILIVNSFQLCQRVTKLTTFSFNYNLYFW